MDGDGPDSELWARVCRD